jgi:hypothetical protein
VVRAAVAAPIAALVRFAAQACRIRSMVHSAWRRWGLRHVLGQRGVPPADAAAHMDSDTLTPGEDLDGAGGDACHDLLAQQSM